MLSSSFLRSSLINTFRSDLRLCIHHSCCPPKHYKQIAILTFSAHLLPTLEGMNSRVASSSRGPVWVFPLKLLHPVAYVGTLSTREQIRSMPMLCLTLCNLLINCLCFDTQLHSKQWLIKSKNWVTWNKLWVDDRGEKAPVSIANTVKFPY